MHSATLLAQMDNQEPDLTVYGNGILNLTRIGRSRCEEDPCDPWAGSAFSWLTRHVDIRNLAGLTWRRRAKIHISEVHLLAEPRTLLGTLLMRQSQSRFVKGKKAGSWRLGHYLDIKQLWSPFFIYYIYIFNSLLSVKSSLPVLHGYNKTYFASF